MQKKIKQLITILTIQTITIFNCKKDMPSNAQGLGWSNQ